MTGYLQTDVDNGDFNEEESPMAGGDPYSYIDDEAYDEDEDEDYDVEGEKLKMGTISGQSVGHK